MSSGVVVKCQGVYGIDRKYWLECIYAIALFLKQSVHEVHNLSRPDVKISLYKYIFIAR